MVIRKIYLNSGVGEIIGGGYGGRGRCRPNHAEGISAGPTKRCPKYRYKQSRAAYREANTIDETDETQERYNEEHVSTKVYIPRVR